MALSPFGSLGKFTLALTSACLLALGISCGSGGGDSAPPRPAIASFVAAKSPITAGTSTTLTAVFSNGTGSIDHGVGAVTSGTPVSITPTADTTYTLTVSGEGGTTTSTVAVQVVASPVIGTFTAAPALVTAGDTSILSCTFTGGTGVISPGGSSIPSGGTQNVTPAATTDYTLTVTNTAGTSVTQTLTVTVVAPPVITGFTNSGPVPCGNSALLTAQFTGGEGIVTGLGAILSGVALPTGSLNAPTLFTLTVTNAAGTSVTATTTVVVTTSLAVTITGLDPLPADVTVSGPGGYSQHLTASQTLTGLEFGTYTLTAATVTDPSQPGLGHGNGGTLGPEFLQRYPLKPTQTVELGSSGGAATVNYPAATLTVEIPTKEDPNIKVPMDFILVPAGTFTMGSDQTADWDALDTRPPHDVTHSQAFYLAKTELTQAQWKAVMGATNNPSNFKNDARPLEQVSWTSFRTSGTGFLDQLNTALPGRNFRLPTEAEWEYALRAGTETAYFFGPTAADLLLYAVSNTTSTATVGSKAPNPWGFYDITGNVRELQEDDSHSGYVGAPDDGSAWVDSPRGAARVVRGGAYDGAFGDRYARSAYRDDADPAAYWSSVGYRLVMPVPSED
jgi:formylglycine-generating enzyme required for sulfatase activity